MGMASAKWIGTGETKRLTEDAGEKLDGNDPVLRLPVSTFVPEIAVLLTQGFGLGMGRRDLPIGRVRRASEDKVARRQGQQSADNAPLIPAKIIQRTQHFQTRAAGPDLSGRDRRVRVQIPIILNPAVG
jgi:hypothetical protein